MMEMVKKQYRKLGRMGNSFGISLPKEMVKKMQAEQGDLFEIVYQDGALTIRSAKHLQLEEDDLSPEMLKALDNTFKKYDKVFQELKHR